MIICADDYGLSPAVSEGIVELLAERKVSVTSCMMIGSEVPAAMEKLMELKVPFDAGLHLVLTDARPLTHLCPQSGLVAGDGRFHSFQKLMINAYKGLIDPNALAGEIGAQLSLFEGYTGRNPDYIDGHQHIQQLPTIRDCVAQAAEKIQAAGSTIYVRVARLPLSWVLTKGVRFSRRYMFNVSLIGLPGIRTARIMSRKQVPHNRFLLGYYNYLAVGEFSQIFAWYLTIKPNENDIFFCHPGYIDETLKKSDTVVESRPEVLEFLKSEACAEMLHQRQTKINTFRLDAS